MSYLHFTRTLLATAIVTSIGLNTAQASDARSIALGGSVIANGKGAPGALANPASLMRMQRDGQRMHFSFGSSVKVRDDAGLVDIAEDDANTGIIDDIENEVNAIDFADLTCDDPQTLNEDDNPVCLENLESLSALSTRAIELLDDVDNDDVRGQATLALGTAFTGVTYPFALHLSARATGAGKMDVSDEDFAYFGEFDTALADAELSYVEITDSPVFSSERSDPNDPRTEQLRVVKPEDVVTSNGEGGYMTRISLGASLATTVSVGGVSVDIGVTPRLSQLQAYGLDVELADEFDPASEDLGDRFEESEVSETAFTFDVGGGMTLSKAPVRLAAVLRTVIPESIETDDGISFDTTPQLVVGGAFDKSFYTLNADLALNEAEVDSFPTQLLALGAELRAGPAAFRFGVNHDMARDEEPTGISLGLGLGPVDFAARASGMQYLHAGLQLSLSF